MSRSLRAVAFAGLCCAAMLLLPGAASAQPIQYLSKGQAIGPFSPAARVGQAVYTSGVIGAATDGTLPADFAAQARNAMQAVAGELELAGASMDDVYSCHVALTDMRNWPAFNAVYSKFFKPERLPVRMAEGVSALAKGAAVEVQCEAHTG